MNWKQLGKHLALFSEWDTFSKRKTTTLPVHERKWNKLGREGDKV